MAAKSHASENYRYYLDRRARYRRRNGFSPDFVVMRRSQYLAIHFELTEVAASSGRLDDALQFSDYRRCFPSEIDVDKIGPDDVIMGASRLMMFGKRKPAITLSNATAPKPGEGIPENVSLEKLPKDFIKRLMDKFKRASDNV